MSDRPYKVLISAMAFPPSTVGSGIYACRLARGFTERGCEVLVLAPEDEERRCEAFDQEQSYRIVRMPWTGFVLRRYLVARKWLRRTLCGFQPDSLWTTNGMSTRVAGLLRELNGRTFPVVSCMRGTDIVDRLPGRGLWARLESIPQRRCYQRSAAIAAASEYLQQVAVAKSVNGEKIFINPSGFDFRQLDDYRYDADRLLGKYPFLQGRKVVLTVARLVKQKRADVAIRAVARVAKDVPELCHVVVGDGPEKARLRRLVEELGVADRVFLIGAVPPMSAALYDLYSCARIFLMPSVREGMANVFMEAGAFGLPSVGVADGGTPELVRNEKTGLLCAADDVAAMADRIGRLLLDPDLAHRMGTRARQWIEGQFSVESLVERSYRVLQEVVEDAAEAGRQEHPLCAGDKI